MMSISICFSENESGSLWGRLVRLLVMLRFLWRTAAIPSAATKARVVAMGIGWGCETELCRWRCVGFGRAMADDAVFQGVPVDACGLQNGTVFGVWDGV